MVENPVIIAIHQPDYIPYIGYFYKIYKSDIFVYLDDAQFSKDNMHHRNKIKTPQGECRIQIPVDYCFKDSINNVRMKDELGWKEKHLKMLEYNYSRSHYYNEIFKQLKDIYFGGYSDLADFNITLNTFIAEKLGILPALISKSSDLGIQTRKEERVLDICNYYNANIYWSGNGARAYQKDESFNKRGIELQYTDYRPIEYKQQFGNFISNLSIIDYIMNHGYDWEFVLKKLTLSEFINGTDLDE